MRRLCGRPTRPTRWSIGTQTHADSHTTSSRTSWPSLSVF
jgi:hypothetical protein